MDNLTDIETDLNVIVQNEGEVREGVTKLSLDDILGVVKEDVSRGTSVEGEPKTESEPKAEAPKGDENKERSNKEIFAEVKALVYVLNFLMVGGSQMVANLMGKTIDKKNINASEEELNRLAKVAQPVYEKHMGKMSDEKLLILAILSIYGFRIMGEFMGAPEEAAKTSKAAFKETEKASDSNQHWHGNPDYFQTGKKAGQRKPKAR